MYFQYANHKNYRIEAFRLLAEINAVASPRIAHQLTWSRGVNVNGGKGKNISLDLHMEHLNRIVKDHVANLGPNVAIKSIIQCSKSLNGIMEVLQNVDDQLEVHPPSTAHGKASMTKDETLIIEELTKKWHVFDYISGRRHPTFKNIRPNIAEHIDKASLLQWINKKKRATELSNHGHCFFTPCLNFHNYLCTKIL